MFTVELGINSTLYFQLLLVRLCFLYFHAQPCFEELVQFMASGPSHVLVVSKPEGTDDVIPAWREFIGPTDVEVAKREKPDR